MNVTVKDWLAGARLRTLPAAIAPVLVGTAFAISAHEFKPLNAFLAGTVALLLQVAVNFANDYSDGIRGTDEYRTGPARLTGGGKVAAKTVLLVALSFFALAGIVGLTLVALCGQWWLLGAGVLALLAGWFYTGGKTPYGYLGLGEVFVLIFFGYMATVGTFYVQALSAPLEIWVAATGVGLIACALLMVNNIRDIHTDEQAQKHTLAVRLGNRRARAIFAFMLFIPPLLASSILVFRFPALISMLFLLPIAFNISRPVLIGDSGKTLISVLKNTGLYELLYAVVITLALLLGTIIDSAISLFAIGLIFALIGCVWLLIQIIQTPHK